MSAAPPRVVRAQSMPLGTPDVPVAIVGAGACGLTAAIFLREAGIDCMLLERDGTPQGSTALSSGFIPAAGTRVQQQAAVDDDSPERFAQDIQAKAKGQAAAHLVKAYSQAIAPAINALGQRHGLLFELLDGFTYPGHSCLRMHSLKERTGAALVAALHNAATRAGALVLNHAQVHELWCDEAGRVLGLACLRPGGQVEYLDCGALLLACNGYGGNPALVKHWLPQLSQATYAGHAGNDGSAVLWGEQLGAGLADMAGCQGHGSWAVPQGVLITWALMTQGGIQVNTQGQRFHDETAGYSEASIEVLRQSGAVAWNVFDERLHALGREFPDFVQAEQAGAVREAADVAALAAVIGCPASTLAASLASSKLQAPYRAIKVTGALFHTQGGLAIDEGCQVLRRDGSVLPNLLAAGGAARGVSGNHISGYLSGNGLLSAIAGGYIAARTLALRAGKELV